jgi:hypothetical protein
MNSLSELNKLAEIPTLMNEEWELSKAMDELNNIKEPISGVTWNCSLQDDSCKG